MTLKQVEPVPIPLEDDTSGPSGRPKAKACFTRGKLLRWLKLSQRYSAYGILVFAGLHLTSTVLLPPISAAAANSAFMAARSIYQTSLGEKLLVYGAFGVHILSGLILRGVRIVSQYRNSGKISLGRPSPIAYSGFALTFITFGHFIANRVSAVKALGDSSLISLDFITFALNDNFPKILSALLLLVALFSFHSIEGMNQYFRLKLRRITRYAALAGIVAVAFKSLMSLAAETVPSGWLAKQYHLVEATTDAFFGS